MIQPLLNINLQNGLICQHYDYNFSNDYICVNEDLF